MKFNKERFARALAITGNTAHSLTSVSETVRYKAKNGKSISAASAKKIADELDVDVSSLIDPEGFVTREVQL